MPPSFKFSYLCVNPSVPRASRVIKVVASHATVADIRARNVAKIFGFSPDNISLFEVAEIVTPPSLFLEGVLA